LEEAILNSFQLPLVSNEFDSDAERVTIDILETLARYKGIEGLPSKTVERIIVSDALRDKIKTETDTKKKSEFIHEAVIQENQKLAQMKENMRRAMSKQGEQIDTFLQVIEEQNQKIGKISSKLDEATDVNRNKENQLQEAKDQAEDAVEKLSDFKRATKWIASVVLLLMSSTALWLHDSWLGWEWLSGHSRQNTVLISLQLMLVFGLLNIPLPKYWKFWVGTLIAVFLAAIAL
jgi:predicted O-linked N-acetylglucosamine transferase (SPINDLY family)